jgi:hypothetical protein
MDGFIKLSRKFFSNELWSEARTFSSCEAWLDLIQSARFEATPRKVSIGGREVVCNRGQYPASIRFLSRRWRWTERKVRTFLSYLKKEGMITSEVIQGMNMITLCKYEEYNSSDTDNDTANDTDIVNIINDLRYKVTQLTTQQVTHPPKKRHTGDTNTKKEEDNNKESPNGDEKEAEASSLTSSNPDFIKFNNWLKRKAPFCSNPKNFSSQITESEFLKLKEKYTGKQIADVIEQIENRKDLRKRYTNLYRTVLNWAKREYGN